MPSGGGHIIRAYGDTQFFEVSRNGAAPGRALTVKSQGARPGGAVGVVRVSG
jgi:hypothetical protein